MVFAIIEDLTGKIEVLVFPRLLESNQEIWEEGNIVSVKGKLSDKDGVFKLLCEEIRRIDMDEAKKYSEENEPSSVISNEAERREKSENITASTHIDFSPENFRDQNDNVHVIQNNNSINNAGIVSDRARNQEINITIPKENSKEILQKLSDILSSAKKGTCEVYISVPSSDGGYKKIKTSRDIEGEKRVLEEISDAVGRENLKCEPLT
jgi:DNA polymerase III alpha subunit